MKRIAIARLWYEGNSFCPEAADAEAFRGREWVAGEAARALYGGTATELGAAVGFLGDNPEWRGTFLRCAAASPAGPMAAGLYPAIRDEILAGLAAATWDAVYLSLHGATVAGDVINPELDLLRAVRATIGSVPLAATFDFHANLDPAIADVVDLAAGYKTYPHTDMDETGAKALRLLAATVKAEIRPVGAIEKCGMALPSFNMRTAEGPMAEVAALANRCADAAPMLDVTPFGGFVYGDVPHGGACAMAFADGDPVAARAAAREVADAIAVRRNRFFVTLPSPEEATARALAAPKGPVAVLDCADNPYSGGIADTPELFRALLAARPTIPAVFAFFHDPDLVAEARRCGVGAGLDCALGGRKTSLYGPPVAVYATVERLTEGRFVNRGPMETNLEVDFGPTAVLDVEGVRVIVTSRCRGANDPAFFELHGIDLAATRLLCVKAKNHFRAAFAPLCREMIDVDAPGPACLDVASLPFRHAPGLAG